MNERSRRVIEERAALVAFRRERPEVGPAELIALFPFLASARYLRRLAMSRGGRP